MNIAFFSRDASSNSLIFFSKSMMDLNFMIIKICKICTDFLFFQKNQIENNKNKSMIMFHFSSISLYSLQKHLLMINQYKKNFYSVF